MKATVLATLLLSGCAAGTAVSQAARSLDAPSVEIIATYQHTESPPVIVSLRAAAKGLVLPLEYHWNLGNGKQWSGPEPLPQAYGVGRYDVLLTVTDADGRIKRASVAIDSKSHGCGF